MLKFTLKVLSEVSFVFAAGTVVVVTAALIQQQCQQRQPQQVPRRRRFQQCHDGHCIVPYNFKPSLN